MALLAHAQAKSYSEEDYYELGENVRAELIDGQFYDMAAPSRIHQEMRKILLNQISVLFVIQAN